MSRIGPWTFDAEGARLIGESDERKLEDRAARTLALLCDRRGEVVSREDILAAVWNGRAVSDNSVAVVMRDLRRALDDDARQPRYIETVAKRGYRLAPAQPARHKPIVPIVALAVVLAAAAIVFFTRSPSPLLLAVEPVHNETGQESYGPLSQALTQVIIDQTARLDGVAVQADAPLRLEGRLILWNGVTALGLTASKGGHVVWTGIAEGQEDVIAKLTAAKLVEMGGKLRHGAGSDE